MKGVYVLVIRVHRKIRIKVGALGELDFSAGLYAYVGSAQNNLELRVKRHIGKEKRLFWHIDYLLNNEASKVVNAYYVDGDKEEECRIAHLIEKNAGSFTGFGCSDCNCTSHLFHAIDFGFLGEIMQPLTVQNVSVELLQYSLK